VVGSGWTGERVIGDDVLLGMVDETIDDGVAGGHEAALTEVAPPVTEASHLALTLACGSS
jgi:hypothetical protein